MAQKHQACLEELSTMKPAAGTKDAGGLGLIVPISLPTYIGVKLGKTGLFCEKLFFKESFSITSHSIKKAILQIEGL